MKFKVLQENISKALSIASRFTNVRAQLPVLANVLIKAQKNNLLISSTNLENSVSISIGAKVEAGGETTVPAKAFTEIVSNLPKDTISIEDNKEKVNISLANFDSTLTCMNSSDFPSIPQSAGKGALRLPKDQILNALTLVLFAASVDETRPVLTGVLLIFRNKELVLVATDGFRLSQKKIKLRSALKKNKIILPKNVLGELVRLVGDKDTISFEYKSKESQAIFEIDNIVLASRTIEGEFPDFEKIIPKETDIKINLDREEMLRAVRLASVFARDSANVVKISVNKDSVELFAESSTAGNQSTRVDAKVTGVSAKGLTIAFNYRFLEDLLNAVKGEEIQIELSDANSPGVFTDPKDKDFLHLIMPVKLQG